ncbi:MAG: hypothetical protein LBF34_02460 [Puniceicoccales bacterium]|nr:hypothetical protein [Puniceicoccales bacterium]
MKKLDYLYGKHSKDGLTLLELFIVILLISIISAVLCKLTFPSKEDLQRKGPKEALEIIIKMARKTANRDAQKMRVLFLDQAIPITFDNNATGSEAGLHIQLSGVNPNCRDSVLNFLQETVVSPPTAWPPKNKYNTKTPLFVVTDAKEKVTFDEDKICYVVLANPIKGQLTKGFHTAFEEGHVDSKGQWKGKRTSHRYFEVYPSGMCNSVSFKGEECQEYNREHSINPVSGIVTVHK